MIEKLVAFEERLTRVEAALLVGVVIFMLVLAVYNVFYRNALIPLQFQVVESATVEVEVPIEPKGEDGSSEGSDGFGGGFGEPTDDSDDDADGFGGGFGGGFDDVSGDDASGEADEAGGFGGGFGDDPSPQDEDVDETGDVADDVEDESGGFGGGFGSNEESDEASDEAESDGFGGGFGGGFDDESDPEDASETGSSDTEVPTTRIERRPPPEGSFAMTVSDTIDAVKLEWIDVVLRQLVLVIGFLGSMLATRRRKHITIDALSKIMPVKMLPWIQVVTNLLSIAVCIFLTFAGWGLVEIGLEFPKELTWFADEWIFQLVFPVGFGLLAFHFGVRLIESVAWGVTGEPVGTIELEPTPTATSATAGDLDRAGGELDVPVATGEPDSDPQRDAEPDDDASDEEVSQ